MAKENLTGDFNIPNREESNLYQFYTKHNLLDKYDLDLKSGDWFRFSNLVFDCILIALKDSQLKLFLWIYRNTIGWQSCRMEVPKIDKIILETGLSRSSINRARDYLIKNRFIYGFELESKRLGKKIECVKINSYIDMWQIEDPNVAEDIKFMVSEYIRIKQADYDRKALRKLKSIRK